MHGRASAAVRAFALYGDTTGETDEFGLPVRYPWARDYRGKAVVVYGHTPVPEATWVNNTICIDTGCVFGGRLTALRYPERELVSVRAKRTYYDPIKPLAGALPLGGDRPREVLDIDDVIGRRGVETRLAGRLTIPEENAAAAAVELGERWEPDWLALDCELLPWSAKAEQLLRTQYAAVGAAATAALSVAGTALEHAATRGVEVAPLLERVRARERMAAL